MTAFHEAGHTLVALLTHSSQHLHKVTILPRGGSGGATYFLPDHKDDGYTTLAEILAEIDVSMGGRVAEEMLLGPDNVTTGAGSDMAQATELAKRFCSLYGMSKIGLSSFARVEPSPLTKTMIDKEVEVILDEAYARVKNLLKTNRDKLSLLAEALLVHETLTAEQCGDVVSGKLLPAPTVKPPHSSTSPLWGKLTGTGKAQTHTHTTGKGEGKVAAPPKPNTKPSPTPNKPQAKVIAPPKSQTPEKGTVPVRPEVKTPVRTVAAPEASQPSPPQGSAPSPGSRRRWE